MESRTGEDAQETGPPVTGYQNPRSRIVSRPEELNSALMRGALATWGHRPARRAAITTRLGWLVHNSRGRRSRSGSYQVTSALT